MYKKVVCAIFLVGLWAAAASAETQHASRPCTKADLVGTWEMKSVSPMLDPKDAVFFQHQSFVFSGDSSMKFISSENSFTKDWLDKFESQPKLIDYSVNEKGFLTLTWQQKPHSETAVCAYALKDVPADVLAKVPEPERKGLPKKGDISLSFLNSAGKVAYRKILEKTGSP